MAFITFFIHTFVGGPRVARPLLADESLPKVSKWLSYYAWHITTVLLALMGVFLVFLAFNSAAAWVVPCLIFLGAQCFCYAVLSVYVATRGGINPLKLPSTTLFSILAAACFWAAFA